jgi:4-carboxymuconolactone decarboxylase
MEKQTAGRKALGDLAPKFAELNDDVLFGQVWSREDKLPTKERCLITISALISKGFCDSSLQYHIQNAKNHGVKKSEMVEVLTQLAFYAGWPNVWAAFPYVKEVYKDEQTTLGDSLFGQGQENKAYAAYFTGKSYLKPIPCQGLGIANVTFEPGCRNFWHIHHQGGQLLLVTDGVGYYQEWGQKARLLHPGDVVEIPPEVKHWHGAGKDEFFTHIAIALPANKATTEWCEEVADGDYLRAIQTAQ